MATRQSASSNPPADDSPTVEIPVRRDGPKHQQIRIPQTGVSPEPSRWMIVLSVILIVLSVVAFALRDAIPGLFDVAKVALMTVIGYWFSVKSGSLDMMMGRK